MGADLAKMKQKIDTTYTPGPPGSAAGPRNPANPVDSTPKVGPSAPATPKAGPSAPAGEVIVLHSQAKWKEHLEASKRNKKLIVINFTATWCKPCQIMKPIISQFATIYSDVEFLQIDVDELVGVAMEYDVQTMPTFILMKKGEIIDRVKGCKRDDLQTKIEKNRR